MIKKHDLPAMPFYIGDWKKDPAVSILTKEQRMLWFEMIMLMWESQERGYLTINGKPMTESMLCSSLNLDNLSLTSWLTYAKNINLYSIREDGAIYSRKIIHIIELSKKRENAGKKGGNPKLVNHSLTTRLTSSPTFAYANAETENETETEDEVKAKRSFKKPKLEQIVEYCKEINSSVDPEQFFHNYESTDWVKANGQKVMNWKSTIRTWEKRGKTQEKSISKLPDKL